MPRLRAFTSFTVFLIIAATSAPVQAQITSVLSGVITDASDGTPLPHASVALIRLPSDSIYAGSSTDLNGRFSIENLEPARYVITARYVGFETRQFEFTLPSGDTRVINFALEPKTELMELIVVTASPLPEKMLNAPVAMTVLGAEDIREMISSSPVEAIQKVPGVDIARTGINRRELVLRGFGKSFTGATYVMLYAGPRDMTSITGGVITA